MLLAGGAFETLQVVHLVLHPHRHLVGTDPLVTGGTETVLAKKPAGQGQRKKENVRTLAETLEERVGGGGG